jgi:hypothetical protein
MQESNTPPAENWKRSAVEVRRERIAELRVTDELPPPWVSCPNIPCGSIGWRMGEGECVMCDWRDWMRGLSRERFISYCDRHCPRESWVAALVRRLGTLRARLTSTPRLPKTWPEWWVRIIPGLESELTTMTWDDYWDSKMKDFEKKYAA